tara:strand:- start:6795 stop:8438 length:1644 start_codon:yes stop_codon:yes gene_type:complete
MKKLLVLQLFLLTILIQAQKNDNLTVGFESNSQYYVDDEKTGDFTEKNRFRSNNYLKIDYSISNFSFGIQAEGYEPMSLLNYSPDFDKSTIALYYAKYTSKKIEATAGYFYEQYGSGLILRSWEDRQLGINNALRGGRIRFYATENIIFSALYGNQRSGFDISDGSIYGFNSEFNISSILKVSSWNLDLGISYVGRKEINDNTDFNFNDLTNAVSSRLNFASNNFYSSAEFVSKSNDAIIIFDVIRNKKQGSAFLFDIGYGKKGFGINANFRRIENMTFYSERNATGNTFNQNIINYIPALTKQHDYLLTNIYVYQAQPQVSFQDFSLLKIGEIGGQVDLFYSLKKKTTLGGKYGTKIALNMSYWAGLSGDFDYLNFEYDSDLLKFGKKYFSDISMEIRKKWSGDWSSVFYYVNQYYNKRYIEETFGIVKSNIFVSESTYKMGSGKSLRFEAQHLWSKDDRKNWVGGTLEFNLNPKVAMYVNDIFNYGNDNEAKRIHYYNFGGSYTLGPQRFALNYGRQRGGLICIGGVCRFVPESTGVTANIVLSF